MTGAPVSLDANRGSSDIGADSVVEIAEGRLLFWGSEGESGSRYEHPTDQID